MPTKDYIPTKESNIVPWTENFIAVLNANLQILGLDATDVANLTTKKDEYSKSLNAAVAKQAESRAATLTKNMSKQVLINKIRVLTRQIQARPGVSNNLKEILGLNVPNHTPTPMQPFQPLDFLCDTGLGGLAYMKWNRNGNPQGTIFLIESNNNHDTGWRIIGTTTKTTYKTTLTVPSGHNFFRVKAQKGELTSEGSNVIIL